MYTARFIVLSSAFALQPLCGVEKPTSSSHQEVLFLKRITSYWQEGNYEDAKEQLNHYLLEYPSSRYLSEVHAMLGDLDFREGAFEKALAHFDKISSLQCAQLSIPHKIACLHELGRYEELISSLEMHPIEQIPLSSSEKEKLHTLVAYAHYRLSHDQKQATDRKMHAQKGLNELATLSSLTDDLRLIQAHLFEYAENTQKAIELYLELLPHFPEQQGELLFRAGILIQRENPSKAISLFQASTEIASSLQKEAAFSELALLFKERRYEDFIQREKELSPLLEKKNSSLVTFYLGSSHFYLDHFVDAASILLPFLASQEGSSEEKRFALQALTVCGYKQKNIALLQSLAKQVVMAPTQEDTYLQTLLALSEVFLENREYENAENSLREALSLFPGHPKRELLLFNYSQSLLLQGSYEKALESFQEYIEKYPSSPRIPIASQNLLFTTCELINSKEGGEKDALKGYLALLLKNNLLSKNALSEEMRPIYTVHLVKLLFDLGQKEEMIPFAKDYLSSYQGSDRKVVYLLLIDAELSLHSSVEQQIKTLEAALLEDFDIETQIELHLRLHNAHLTNKAPEKGKEHLLFVYQHAKKRLKKENLFWLAAQCEKDLHHVVAKELLEEALFCDNTHLIPCSFDPFLFEEEVFHLKNLYLFFGETHKGIDLLNNLLQLQLADVNTPWKSSRKAQFELAELYELEGRKMDALSLYENLIQNKGYTPNSYFVQAALLKKAQIELSLLDPEKEEKLSSILDTLKDLQITKNVRSEPIHLEAALEYASIRVSHAPQHLQNEKMAFYLERIEEDFFLATDECTLSYNVDRAKWPDQNTLINHYLAYISSEKKRLQSLEAKKNGNEELSFLLKTEAKKQLESLQEVLQEDASSLSIRVKQSLAKIEEGA